jgi:2-dehydropantoate 2-reductase
VGVLGAGTVGCYVGGKLTRAKGVDAVFVGRPRMQGEVRASGLTLTDLTGADVHVPASEIVFETTPEMLADCDVVLCCVKSGHTADVASALQSIVPPDALVVSLQNGVGNALALRERLGKQTVLAGIVAFNVVPHGAGGFEQTTKGGLLLQASDHPKLQRFVAACTESGVGITCHEDIERHQWSKLLVNLNNAVSALSDVPTQQMVLSERYRRVIAALMQEGLTVLKAAGIRPAPLRGMPLWLLPRLLRLPTPIVRLVARAQLGANPEARSSMWEDLVRGRTTEVEFLNGEIVRLAEQSGTQAPLNQRMVELVHRAERAGDGSPKLAADVLLDV